jgi:hypothetical protein
MSCQDIRAALAPYTDCIETESGSRFRTHCLYPSFEPVDVFVVRFGDGFRINDGGGAYRSAWDHGRDDGMARRAINRQATAYHLSVENDQSLAVTVNSPDWLLSGILAVANASAGAAHAVFQHVTGASETMLKERIFATLAATVPVSAIAKEYEMIGKSGKRHHFDYAIQTVEQHPLLVESVTPHHVSISAKYVAFADTSDAPAIGRFAVCDRPLDNDDTALLQQVAAIVPFASLGPGITRQMVGHRAIEIPGYQVVPYRH